jgi:hypothetical protein
MLHEFDRGAVGKNAPGHSTREYVSSVVSGLDECGWGTREERATRYASVRDVVDHVAEGSDSSIEVERRNFGLDEVSEEGIHLDDRGFDPEELGGQSRRARSAEWVCDVADRARCFVERTFHDFWGECLFETPPSLKRQRRAA